MANSPIIAFRCPAPLKHSIAVAAARRFASTNEYIRRMLIDAVERDGGFDKGNAAVPHDKPEVPA